MIHLIIKLHLYQQVLYFKFDVKPHKNVNTYSIFGFVLTIHCENDVEFNFYFLCFVHKVLFQFLLDNRNCDT